MLFASENNEDIHRLIFRNELVDICIKMNVYKIKGDKKENYNQPNDFFP